ncbi:subtilisin-like protein [Ascoidea rubescens DSM 1968]|uniref:Subtilisin-like protein n=1 Tax=Ascoidea rubescens DSM 1968 TaxID=1344418 RepID=A0A1D2VDJ7_9ASCO|nr:subtilisin-like protein [Ascoidea rubescens DSM 1968]ODV59711.1 subtilisin-like protein [Ascoidea rubescens DSM 1968]
MNIKELIKKLPFLLLMKMSFSTSFELEEAENAIDINEIYDRTVPGNYIIEYDSNLIDLMNAEDINSNTEDGSRGKKLKGFLKDEGIKADIIEDLSSIYFSGVSIDIINDNSTILSDLKKLDYVIDAWPVGIMKLEDPLFEPKNDKEIRGEKIGIDDKFYNPHLATGVDKLHEMGILGEGVTIGVIDSGINYNIDSLGGGIGDGYKVEWGYDYVGNWESEEPIADSDPMDCIGHGTFVSNVIVGDGDEESKLGLGVAPKSKIRMYKVFGCFDGTRTDIIMRALIDAAEDEVDIINLSLGADQGYSSMPISKLASSISERIPIVYAAGNSGDMGSFFAASGASGKNVIAVGSTSNSSKEELSFFKNEIGKGFGKMSEFSSWGPTYENNFYPTISAPGGKVFGPYNNEWGFASGTSFAAPYISGVIGLYLSVNKQAKPIEIMNRLVSSSDEVLLYDGNQVLFEKMIAPLNQQGSGIVNAMKFMEYKTEILSSTFIELNDTSNRVSKHKIEIYNGELNETVYEVYHEAGVTVKARDELLYPLEYFPKFEQAEAHVDISTSILRIASGGTESIEVEIGGPKSRYEDGSIFGGKVVISGTNNETVKVPYMGVELSSYNWTALEGMPLLLTRKDGRLRKIRKDERFNLNIGDDIRVYYALRYGSEEFSIDLVSWEYEKEMFDYPPSKAAAWKGSIRSTSDKNGQYTSFPLNHIVRFNKLGFVQLGGFADGRSIPSGKYKLLIRCLRVFGDKFRAEDWQLFLSDSFSVGQQDVIQKRAPKEARDENVCSCAAISGSSSKTRSRPDSRTSTAGSTTILSPHRYGC